ncbi:unnamed protein product [Acanthoscelides obtectus]|uniref:HAT C-terminal dimerisation domain-containing protein n=1 Tax=Acanthoscelides obtectus TaxID=200917 RepID=A0A9P0KCI7_ACAOB|nr:unnamed protein product [Acanthoscelides obtectus]CAK1640048.1 Zinc finger protein 862 [Acanthoscelides obtectus]
MPKEKESLYTRKYRVAWESDAELKGWIGPVLADETKSLCKICKCTLAAHKKDLLLHGKSKKHQEAEKRSLAGPSKKITEFMKKDSKYSLIIDESTAVDSTKMLCVMIKYFSKKQTKIVTTFYKLIEIEKGDAITISAAVTKQLELDGLKLGNLIGIGVDGANVMVGAHNSVASFLKAKNNELVIIKCVCHSLHLAAEYAFKLLPRHLDFIIKECHNWFSCSTKRQIAYKQIFETLTDQKPLKIDQLSGTRWLARYNAIVKILEQWDALKIHFGIVKDNERCYMAEQLFQMLSDQTNVLYFTFLSWTLKEIIRVNKLFQSECADPLKLMEDLNLLLFNNLSILVPPMRLQKISKNNVVDFKFEDYIMDIELINLGYSFNSKASSLAIKQDELLMVRTRCKDFLVELCRQIQMRIPESMNILEKINSFNPELATSKIRQPEITNIALSFSTICPDLDSTIAEWKSLPRINWINLPDTEKFWVEVANNVDAAGEPRYKNISSLALALLSLPFSNASVERAFSIINVVKNKLRNRLAIHSTDAIMRVRWYLCNLKNGCTDFQPTENMLQYFNSERMYDCKKEEEEVLNAFSEL